MATEVQADHPNGFEPVASTSGPRQLPINLYTRSSTDAIPTSTYFLPASWRRYQLSELINKVLKYPTPVPFDFLINSEVLRGSLEAWVQRNRGGDEEGTLDVEYVRSLLPPEEVGRMEMDDWVSGLSLKRSGSASSLRTVRIKLTWLGLKAHPRIFLPVTSPGPAVDGQLDCPILLFHSNFVTP